MSWGQALTILWLLAGWGGAAMMMRESNLISKVVAGMFLGPFIFIVKPR